MNTANREVVEAKFGRSFSLKHYLLATSNDKSTFWHFHPEVELVYVKGGSGIRHVGSHISHFRHGDLVLIGSNLPHNGFTDKNTGHTSEVVIQFLESFAGDQFLDLPEMKNINSLLQRAKHGIAFHGKTKRYIGMRMERIATLDPFNAMVELIKILQDLASSQEFTSLQSANSDYQVSKQDNDRTALVFDYIRRNYTQDIELSQIAMISSLTVPSFCRFFKSTTGKTFTNFLNEFRIIEACKQLREKNLPISDIALSVGFNNTAYFNRHFRRVTGATPSHYRKEITELIP